MRPANITRWRAYSLKNVSFLESGLEIAIKMESSYYMCFQGLEKFEEQKMQLSSCLICRIRYMPEQQSKKHVCVFGCAFSVEHTPRPCRGVHFVSLLSLRVLTCFFFFSFLPQHCLDCQSQLSNTSPSERQAEFTLSQSAPRCVCMCRCVLTCARVLARGGGWWSSIHSNCQPSLSQIPHMSCYLSEKDGRQPPRFPTTLHPEVNFIREELQMCCSE